MAFCINWGLPTVFSKVTKRDGPIFPCLTTAESLKLAVQTFDKECDEALLLLRIASASAKNL